MQVPAIRPGSSELIQTFRSLPGLPLELDLVLHHLLPYVPNDDFFLSLPALSSDWHSVLAQHGVHRMACRYRFRMSEPQYRVFASGPWRRLRLRPDEAKEAPGTNQSAGLLQSQSQSLAGKDWRGECYSLFKIIRQVEMSCFGAVPTDCRVPHLPLSAARPRPRPRFHLPQPFQA